MNQCQRNDRPHAPAFAVELLGLVRHNRHCLDESLVQVCWATRPAHTILLIATAEGQIVLKMIMPMIDHSEKRILALLPSGDRQKFIETLNQVARIENIYSRALLDGELYADIIGRTGIRNRNSAEAE